MIIWGMFIGKLVVEMRFVFSGIMFGIWGWKKMSFLRFLIRLKMVCRNWL